MRAEKLGQVWESQRIRMHRADQMGRVCRMCRRCVLFSGRCIGRSWIGSMPWRRREASAMLSSSHLWVNHSQVTHSQVNHSNVYLKWRVTMPLPPLHSFRTLHRRHLRCVLRLRRLRAVEGVRRGGCTGFWRCCIGTGAREPGQSTGRSTTRAIESAVTTGSVKTVGPAAPALAPVVATSEAVSCRGFGRCASSSGSRVMRSSPPTHWRPRVSRPMIVLVPRRHPP